MLYSVDRDRPAHFFHDSFADSYQFRLIGLFADQNPKLVAAQARDAVCVARIRLEAGRNDRQQLVTRLVALGVVHLFEAVEVCEKNGAPAIVPFRALKCPVQPICKGLTIQQTGQCVVVGLAEKCSFAIRMGQRN